jgi:hypothetical protein
VRRQHIREAVRLRLDVVEAEAPDGAALVLKDQREPASAGGMAVADIDAACRDGGQG